MPQLQEFDLIFFKGTTWVGKLVKFFTGEKYSHTAIALDPFHLVETNYNTPVAVRHIKISTKDYDVYRLKKPLTTTQRLLILQFIHNEISKKYDWKFLFTRWLNLLFGIKPLNSKNRYNCDELVLEAFRVVGISLINDDVFMTPEKLSKSELLEKVVYTG